MSILTMGSTLLDGMRLGEGGTEFLPMDDTSSLAVYERGGRVCGVELSSCLGRNYLVFSPGWQLPAGARDERSWKRFAFDHPDQRMLDLLIDFDDGEVKYPVTESGLVEVDDIARAVDEGLDFVFSIYPDVVAYVAGQLGR